MKTWTPEELDQGFDMTPMIDIVFLLIAFFMTLISFISSELIKLELPEAKESTIPEDTSERQYISIDADGFLYLGIRKIEYEQLPTALRQLHSKQPKLKVYLRADAKTPHNYVSKAMTACGDAGIVSIIFGTIQE